MEPKCECHGVPQVWHKDKRKEAGGHWICAVRKRENEERWRRAHGIGPRPEPQGRNQTANTRRWRERHPEAWSNMNRRMVARARVRRAGGVVEKYDVAEIFARSDGLCVYCDNQAAEIDHVVPVSAGGADAEWNVVGACSGCNRRKGAGSLPRVR